MFCVNISHQMQLHSLKLFEYKINHILMSALGHWSTAYSAHLRYKIVKARRRITHSFLLECPIQIPCRYSQLCVSPILTERTPSYKILNEALTKLGNY